MLKRIKGRKLEAVEKCKSMDRDNLRSERKKMKKTISRMSSHIETMESSLDCLMDELSQINKKYNDHENSRVGGENDSSSKSDSKDDNQ